MCWYEATRKDKKIVFFSRFFGEKSVFGWVGNDFGKEKSEVKKSEKNADFSEKTNFFPKKNRFFLKFQNFPLFFPWFQKYEKIGTLQPPSH